MNYINEAQILEYEKESRFIREDNIKTNNFYKNKEKKHKQLKPVIHSVENINQKPSINSTNSNSSTNTQKNKKTNRKVNNLQFIFQTVSKSFKKDGIFIYSDKPYNNIDIFKDSNVTLFIDNKKILISVRFLIGKFENFKNISTQYTNDVFKIKEPINQFINHSLSKINIDNIVQKDVDNLLNEIDKQKNLQHYKARFIKKIIEQLRKTTKQNKGYKEKLNELFQLWKQEANELNSIQLIEDKLNFKSYEQSFQIARNIKRKFSILIGPTNSGKTHTALDILAQNKNGIYLAPLRLLAQEGQENLFNRNIISDLITGEERKIIPGATHTSSTVEMCNFNKLLDCAVIDEIQMIADKDRGWAWSQALVGVPAKHVILVGSQEALPYIIPIIENLNEEYEIQYFERKTPISIREQSIYRLQDLKEGDCIVVFSRKSALETKNMVENIGKKCSIIYGNLSPEIRKIEAQKFKSRQNPILIATDAIGMGLNLPIKRLFFSTLEKFDGVDMRYLNTSEIKQIAGRTGRYGLHEYGEVGLLFNNNTNDMRLLKNSINAIIETPSDVKVYIAPNLFQIQTICDILEQNNLYKALIFFKEKLIQNNQFYKAANLDNMIQIAGMIKNKNLSLDIGLNYCCVPIDLNSDFHTSYFFKFLNNHIQNKENIAPKLPENIRLAIYDSVYLYDAELYVKICMSYQWLHYRYPKIYNDFENAINNVFVANKYIEKILQNSILYSKSKRQR